MMSQQTTTINIKTACLKLITVLVLCVASANTYAYQLFYDRTGWESAVTSSLISDNFVNGVPPANSITFDSGVISSRALSSEYNYVGSTSQAYLGSVTSSSSLTWVFPWEISAFGFDIVSINSGSQISGKFDDSGLLSFDPGNDNNTNIYNGFVGIIGDTRFDSIVFSGSGGRDSFVVDNLSFSKKAPTIPEPASLLLMGLGLFGIGYSRKKPYDINLFE